MISCHNCPCLHVSKSHSFAWWKGHVQWFVGSPTASSPTFVVSAVVCFLGLLVLLVLLVGRKTKAAPVWESLCRCFSALEEPHAGCDAEAGSDSRKDGYDCLNDEFPSFLFHSVVYFYHHGFNGFVGFRAGTYNTYNLAF